MFLKKPFYLGNTELPSNIFYAPLAGCSDYPFRKMSALYRPGIMFCEMVKMDALVRNDSGTLKMLEYSEDMRPIGGQLCGSKVELAKQSAKIIEDLGFTSIDFNCGCPVDKVTKDGSGSGMLKSPEKIGAIISEMVSAVKIPVTVKIRTGWDESTINCAQITEIAEKAGAKAICIHGRTRAQAYRGNANWDHIKACKEAAKEIKVIGNGDLFDPSAVLRMFEYTHCDAVLIARGTMGKPWIAEDVYNLLQGLEVPQRSMVDNCNALIQHYEFMKAYHPERRTLIDMRRVGCWYIKNIFGASEFRQLLCKAESLSEIDTILKNVLIQVQDPNFTPAKSQEVPEEESCESCVS